MRNSYILILMFLAFVQCTQKEGGQLLISDSLSRRSERPSSVSMQNETKPKDYCIIKMNHRAANVSSEEDFFWTINGYKLTVDSLGEFKVKTYGGLDTMIFNNPSRKTIEFILCDLVKGERYEITSNACCGDFNFWKENRYGANLRSVEFNINERPKTKKLIGGVSFEAAFLKVGTPITLTGDYMWSPMFPNRHRVYVQDFEPWHEDSTMARVIDSKTRKELGAFRDLDHKLIDFQYIFLDNDKLKVFVDEKTGVSVERVK